MTTAVVDFNGVVPEKFDAVKLSHLVDAEYGNQGIDFKMVPREGFGWMNGTSKLSICCWNIRVTDLYGPLAAYQVGLTFLTSHMRRAVAACTSPELFFNRRDIDLHGGAVATKEYDPLGIAMNNAMDSLNLELASSQL